MIYLYYDKLKKLLYMSEDPIYMDADLKVNTKSKLYIMGNVESVTADQDRNQILAHGPMGNGIVAEYPLSRTMLSCEPFHA